MKRSLTPGLALLILLLVVVPLFAVGTTTVTSSDAGGGITKVAVAWVSSAGGAVSGNAITDLPRGRLLQVRATPDSGGTAPTDLYDLTLVDTASGDVLAGAGANLPQATSKYLLLNPPVIYDTSLDVVIANAGNAKGGTVTLWIQRTP